MASASPLDVPVAVDPLYVEIGVLLRKRLTGIGRFAARLVEALSRLTPLRLVTLVQADRDLGRSLSCAFRLGQEIPVSPGDLSPADGDLEGWVKDLIHRPRRRHNSQLSGRCPALFTELRPGYRHFRRELCILYDFTPYLLPWTHVKSTVRHFGSFFTQTAPLCDKAVAISESTRSDAAWMSDLPPENVVVGYPGPSLCTDRHACAGPVARRDDRILVVSTVEPRKNARFLADWFANTEVLAPGTELWWAGPSGWLDKLAAANRRGGRPDRKIRFLGMVSDSRLCELYRQATFAVYPSLYEGFGFPVLDALNHGAPVLTSFNSSLKEFAGPGVFYFDAYDPATLDEACRALFASRPAAFHRPDLRARFSWDALARTVLSLCA